MPTSLITGQQRYSQDRLVYCINPKCKQRQNPDHLESCQACKTPLLLLNRYQLILPLRPLDVHGLAEIFEVEDLSVEEGNRERHKVLKVLKKNTETLVRLFKQEANTLRKLHHPGIPKVPADNYFTVSIPQKPQILHCLLMEKVEGENLLEWVNRNKRITQDKALKWLIQLLEVLDYLHQNQYFHRDIKPSNIMLRSDGQLVLIDFGTVREITGTYIAKVGSKEEITCIWSAGYTPEEAINGKAVPQSDFYALGRTFVHLLTGQSPLELPKVATQLKWRECAPQVSSSLAAWIDYLMAASPLQRPPNASFVLKCLEGKTAENLPFPPIEPTLSTTPRWLILLNFGLFSILLVTGLLWFQKHQENRWQMLHKQNPSAEVKN